MTSTGGAQKNGALGVGGSGLTTRPLTRRLPEYREVIALYRRAFPPEEQIPMWRLRLMTLRRGVELRAWYDGQVLVGMTYTVESPTMVWLFYLVVNDAVRSQGYGSRIVQQVRRRAAGRTVVLEIEPLDDTAANAEQRRRRVAFYERNGFTLSGRSIVYGSRASYALMADAELDVDGFLRLVRRFSLGLERVSIQAVCPP